MLGFNGGLIGKSRPTSSSSSLPGVWTSREQEVAIRNFQWIGAGFLGTGGSVEDLTINGIKYRIHTFNATGTLTVTSPGLVEYLVVAGGGGAGGRYEGGGGGAGGLLTDSGLFISSTQTITVGEKGTGGRNGLASTNGGNSSIGTLVVCTGGGRGGQDGLPATSGGSGGGGSWTQNPATIFGGAGIDGQGFAGGNGSSSPLSGAGGGGATSVGANAASGVSQPSGGTGYISSISGSPITYATGGSGALRSAIITGTNAIANRGNGGNGASSGNDSGIGGDGGTGVVIIRYPIP